MKRHFSTYPIFLEIMKHEGTYHIFLFPCINFIFDLNVIAGVNNSHHILFILKKYLLIIRKNKFGKSLKMEENILNCICYKNNWYIYLLNNPSLNSKSLLFLLVLSSELMNVGIQLFLQDKAISLFNGLKSALS